jgi:hypothetical protein
MRKFYEEKRLTRKLTQGSIINYCLADNYGDVEKIYGFIVTPRCDLAHEAKVTHAHYLPIVDFKDWAEHDGKDYLFNKWFCKKKDKFEGKCRLHQFPISDVSYSNYEKMANMLIDNKADKEDFLSLASIVTHPQKDNEDFIKYSNKKETKTQLVKDLLEDKLAAFYLIEDWNGNDKHKVILLRELKHISILTTKKISNGLCLSEIIEGKDELKKISDSDDLCLVCAQIVSPFVEHIMQRFSHNFCRIGVDDRDFVKEKDVLFNQL